MTSKDVGEILERITDIVNQYVGGSSPDEIVLEALRFYANEANWKSGGTAFEPTPAAVAADKGELARKALGMGSAQGKPGKASKGAKKTPPAKPKKGAKSAKSKPEPEERETRPPVEMIEAKCQSCSSKQKLPRMMVMNKITEDGNAQDYYCPKCIRGRKVINAG